jgi:plasmid stability protein
MGNLTVSMDDTLIQEIRVQAAKSGKSMSRFVADVLEKQVQNGLQSEARKQERLAALQRIFDGPMWDVTENGRMPTAEERNARR